MRIITALGLLALALGVRMLLDPWLGDSLSYPSMLTAVVLAAWYCGPGPAILIAIIGYPAIEYLFRDVPFGGGKLQYLVPSLGLYAGLVWVVVYFVNTLRHAHEQLRATQEDLRQSEQHNRAWFEQVILPRFDEHQVTQSRGCTLHRPVFDSRSTNACADDYRSLRSNQRR